MAASKVVLLEAHSLILVCVRVDPANVPTVPAANMALWPRFVWPRGFVVMYLGLLVSIHNLLQST